MKKPELLKSLATSANVTQGQADALLGALITVIVSDVLVKGIPLTIPGLGTFKQVKAAAKIGRHPVTGAPLNVPESTRITFKMTSSLK